MSCRSWPTTIPKWLYADMGTMGAGGVSNGI